MQNCLNLYFSAPGIAHISLHPPHLTESKGLPALIPFCAYGGNMKVLGQKIDGLNFSVCNAFKPTILDGEVCYALNIKDLISNGSIVSRPGRGEGLLLAIDNGISIKSPKDKGVIDTREDYIRTKLKSTGERARLQFMTLHRQEVTRPGIYTMKNLKQMIGTENFLAMPDEAKKCQIELREKCRSRRYLQEVQRKCGCIPWGQSSFAFNQVKCFLDALASLEPTQVGRWVIVSNSGQ